MGCRTRWPWLLAALAGIYAAGCTKSNVRRPDPPDPLLQSKPPAQSKYTEGPEQTGRAEPTPPTMPAGAWISAPARLQAPQGALTSESRSTGPLTWSSDKQPELSSADKEYDRSRDYRWVQGVLEKSVDEQWLLRYEPISRDVYAGKVVLEGHPRLDLLRPGDLIRVEGALVEENGTAAANAWIPHPRYRVDSLTLIRRAN